MRSKQEIAIVGAGNLGVVLAEALHAAGYRVSEVISRGKAQSRRKAERLARRIGAQATTIRDPELTADLVWFCVPDRTIAAYASALAKHVKWQGRVAVHSSGALESGELDALRRRGAKTASAHPLMTFVPSVKPTLKGVAFAIEGDAEAVRRVRAVIAKLGGKSYRIHPREKAAYHAWGTFASPLLVALLALTERVASAGGVRGKEARDRVLPILRQTLANYDQRGAAGAFSGPIIRGDAETVRKHLRVLKRVPGAEDAYRALARSALRNLPVRNRSALRKLLESDS